MKRTIPLLLLCLVLMQSFEAVALIVMPCNCVWHESYTTMCPEVVITYNVDDEVSTCCYDNRLPGHPVTGKIKMCNANMWIQLAYIDEAKVKSRCNMGCTARMESYIHIYSKLV